jgi:hypothetical protein
MLTAFDYYEQRLLTLAQSMQFLGPGVETAWREVYRLEAALVRTPPNRMLPEAAHRVAQRVTQARRVALEYEEAYQRLSIALDAVQAELVIAE